MESVGKVDKEDFQPWLKAKLEDAAEGGGTAAKGEGRA